MFRGIIDSLILKELNVELRNIVSMAKSNASWSSKIPPAISSTPATTDGRGKYEASIKVDLVAAPMAAAFEFGSGIHRKDDPKTYRIPDAPKVGLAFMWDKVDETSRTGRKFRGILPDGRASFTFVDHPGVAAKPFLQPAINSRSFYLSRALAKAFGVGILDVIKTEWKTK